ncbi:MAG: ABC transporter ATP-binding protein [Planctomycetota bacterium]
MATHMDQMIDSPAALPSQPDAVSAVELRNVIKVYGQGRQAGTRALDGVRLSIRAGEAVALLGRSGSGKSTLLNLIGAMDVPTSGEVVLGGRPISAMSGSERTVFRRRRLGFVFQSFHLVPSLSVLENAAVPWMLDGAFDAEARRDLTDLLGGLGLADKLGVYPDELSGGQRQRVAIARALARRPELVLADEPTGNLDSSTGASILDLFDRLRRDRGFTLVLATHDELAAERCSSRIVLEDGRVVEGGA